jgi:hypothetical protein
VQIDVANMKLVSTSSPFALFFVSEPVLLIGHKIVVHSPRSYITYVNIITPKLQIILFSVQWQI